MREDNDITDVLPEVTQSKKAQRIDSSTTFKDRGASSNDQYTALNVAIDPTPAASLHSRQGRTYFKAASKTDIANQGLQDEATHDQSSVGQYTHINSGI